ncbi:MAG: hypothetical protein WDW38_001696 [Sanguina aurantia]
MSAKAMEEALLTAIRKYPEGATNEQLAQELPQFSAQSRVDALNKLAAARKLQVFTGNNTLTYKETKAEEVAKLKGLTSEELMLYQFIKQAANTGMWTKDMKMRSNLAQAQITKILKNLEARRLVKGVKNVNNPSRKLFMLYELEPSRELTGGAWYTENQFDAEFIGVLQEACYKFIVRNADCTLVEVAEFIQSRGFSKVDLRQEDVQMILNTLYYDGRIEFVESNADDDDHYRVTSLQIPESTPMTMLPCGTCVYYDKWLSFDK